MSFQGDVAGIGLGELLQGLARGGRDGVLTLRGERLTAALGLHRGQLYVLPAPDEEEALWRERCHRAWAEREDPELETSRRMGIARAGRLETVYRMLASPNLHFRFEPGPLPIPQHVQQRAAVPKNAPIAMDGVAPSAGTGSPWGPGMTVEFMLLEHARIADESSSGSAAHLTEHDLPRALDAAQAEGQERDLLEQCDGTSTLEEIADRLEITLSRCRSTVGELIDAGLVRLAQPRELLAATLRELECKRYGRAATRLTGWIRQSPPGGPLVGDADLLIGEWHNGGLEPVMMRLQPSDGRTLLRKLDLVHDNRKASCQRWTALSQAHRGDQISALHEVVLRLTVDDPPETRTFHELLRIAKNFHETGHDGRTRALLRFAASYLPSRPQTRVELGKRMLDSGLADEGVRWLLDTARELNDAGQGERAMVPIRIVLRRIPDHAEANELLLETRTLVAQRRRRRWSILSGLSAGLVLSLVALVRFHKHRDVSNKISQVQAHMDDPKVALALLNDFFGGNAPEEVVDLRESLRELKEEAETLALAAWTEKYETAEEECTIGDPVIGLRLALELPDPPDVSTPIKGKRQDLFGHIARRLNRRSEELDLPPMASPEDLHQEQRLVQLMEDMLEIVPEESDDPAQSSFRFKMEQLHETIVARSEERARRREEILASEREREQDLLLAAARAHDRAGDLDRALAAYERLVKMDPELSDLPEFRKELDEVRAHYHAVERARELCSEGEHQAAEAVLEGVCKRPVEHLMPWRIESRPSGAHVTLPDGRVRITPFTANSAFGERVELRLEFPGCEDRTITLTKPRDLLVHLHSHPERVWSAGSDVEAAPVAVGSDHILADRHGRLVRLDGASNAKWTVKLDTLGGIARTPVFLPERPGHLLVLSEDGVAWLVDAANGEVDGPREIGSPPRQGPSLTRAGVTASFADGRIAVWTRGLEPSFYKPESMIGDVPRFDPEGDARNATLAVLTRGVDRGLSLVSPWTDWRVVVADDEYLVTSPDGRGFSAARAGDWNYVAWESPKALLPRGRLWVSDAEGVRSYLPENGQLVLLNDR